MIAATVTARENKTQHISSHLQCLRQIYLGSAGKLVLDYIQVFGYGGSDFGDVNTKEPFSVALLGTQRDLLDRLG